MTSSANTGRVDWYQPGDWDATCFECGAKFKASQLKKTWQGYYVCLEHWDARQPQDFVKGVVDNTSVPWSQPPSDNFIYICSPENMSGIAGLAAAGCALPNYRSPMIDYSIRA